MFQEAIVSLIREKCPSEWELVVFKDRILVQLPETAGDFLPRYRQVKKEITAWVTEQFPVPEEVLFEIRSSAWNCSFKLGRNKVV